MIYGMIHDMIYQHDKKVREVPCEGRQFANHKDVQTESKVVVH